MLSDELAKLRNLHQQGELSDEEYTAAKAQLLNHPKALVAKDHPIVDYLYGMTPNTYHNLTFSSLCWIYGAVCGIHRSDRNVALC